MFHKFNYMRNNTRRARTYYYELYIYSLNLN